MKLTKRHYFLASAGVFIIAFFIRWQAFSSFDFFYFQDQSRDLLLAKEIVEQGKIILIGARTGFGGLFHGPLWIYSLIPTYLTFAGNPFWTLIPVYLIYSLGIVLAGLLVGIKLYGKGMGLLFAFFLSISAPLVASIYFMTNAHAMPLIFAIYLYFIILYLRGNQKGLIASMFMIGVGFQYEPAYAAVLIPLTLIAIAIIRKLNIKYLLVGIGVLILSVSNFIIFDLRHNFLMTQSFLRLTKGSESALSGYENYQNLIFRISDRATGLINSFSMQLYSSDLLSRAIVFMIIALALLTIVKKLRKTRKFDQKDKEYLFIFSILFISYFAYILYPYPLWSHYVLPLVIPAALLLSLSIRRIYKEKYGLLISALLIVVVLIPVFDSLYVGSQSPNRQISNDSGYKNQLLVAQWVLKDSGNQPFNYLVYIPSTFTYGMDYLFSWKTLVGERKITPCSKSGLTYLIYYPPLEGDKEAHSFWKKNIIKTDAKPLTTKKFNGNIMVEKISPGENEPPIDSNYCQNLAFR